MGLSTNQSNQIRIYFLQGIWLIGTEFSNVFFHLPRLDTGGNVLMLTVWRGSKHVNGAVHGRWSEIMALLPLVSTGHCGFSLRKWMKIGKMVDLPRENAVFFSRVSPRKKKCDFTWPKLGIYVDCCMIAKLAYIELT